MLLSKGAGSENQFDLTSTCWHAGEQYAEDMQDAQALTLGLSQITHLDGAIFVVVVRTLEISCLFGLEANRREMVCNNEDVKQTR